jgi:hypothetical protein
VQLEEAQNVLDRFAIAERLQHIRRFVWRGGTLRFATHGACAFYELEVQRQRSVLEPTPAARPGLERTTTPVVEGRWVQRSTSHVLRVGIDLAVPSAIFIRADRFHAFVPYAHRTRAEVERALQAELSAYVSGVLDSAAG